MNEHPRRWELARYHAGDLEATETEKIRAHLAGCQPCRCFIRELEKRRQEFLERHPASEAVPEIMSRARPGGRPLRWWRRLRGWLAGGRS